MGDNSVDMIPPALDNGEPNSTMENQIRRLGANRPWCTIPGIFVGYNFLKAHPIPFKMTLVSTLSVGAFGRSGLLNALRT